MNLSDLFEYRDGDLYWKIKRSSATKLDKPAGYMSCGGYRSVEIKEVGQLKVHRIIWELHHGPIPEGLEIDHINRIRDDNRIENLRLCDHAQNAWNRVHHAKNKYPGVQFIEKSKKYRARINYYGKKLHIGYFDTLEEASDAYKKKQQELHGEFAYD